MVGFIGQRSVTVRAPARLHLGMFDLTGSLGRRFGGIGVAIAQPGVVVHAALAPALSADGPDAARALEWAQRYLRASGIHSGAHLRIEQVIPAHSGLGSGTKLALAIARALAVLYDQSTDPFTLARMVGRGARSAIGLWTFASGGFVLEGGRYPDRDTPAPLLLQRPMPRQWRCVLAIPHAPEGLTGTAEATAFQDLAPPAALSAQIAHQTLMALLPALVEEDINEFGRALTQIQRLVGESFSPVQGGTFANARSAQVIESLLGWGAPGAGQSSWGPAVYGLAANEQQAQTLAARTTVLLDGQGTVAVVPFDNAGVQSSEH